jgi:hypothetical protein
MNNGTTNPAEMKMDLYSTHKKGKQGIHLNHDITLSLVSDDDDMGRQSNFEGIYVTLI